MVRNNYIQSHIEKSSTDNEIAVDYDVCSIYEICCLILNEV